MPPTTRRAVAHPPHHSASSYPRHIPLVSLPLQYQPTEHTRHSEWRVMASIFFQCAKAMYFPPFGFYQGPELWRCHRWVISSVHSVFTARKFQPFPDFDVGLSSTSDGVRHLHIQYTDTDNYYVWNSYLSSVHRRRLEYYRCIIYGNIPIIIFLFQCYFNISILTY